MKSKKISKKIAFNKTTISHLQMKEVTGGHIPTWTAGDSYCGGDASCLTCVWLCNTDYSCHRTCPA